ncbi:MAG: BatA domain-containing protein [Verrucomicrobiota bacterium]
MPAFANPLGFLALLGLPAIVAIHYLQQKSKITNVSTLFLLEQIAREDVTGHRFERFRRSIPFWLQLLGVLFLTWLLVQPRWIGKDSVQRVAIVLDSTASMEAHREKTVSELEKSLADIAPLAARSEYVVLESHSTGERLFAGSDRAALRNSLRDWRPRETAHDPVDAFRLARSLVGPAGIVVYATDHQQANLPFEAVLFSAASAMPNCGFTGMETEVNELGEVLWKAMLRNHGNTPQTRTWRIEVDGVPGATNEITLDAGDAETIRGPFPDGVDRVVLRLDPDRFSIDDSLPLLRPQEKSLDLNTVGETEPFEPLFKKILQGIPGLERVPVEEESIPDVTFVIHDPLQPAETSSHACLFSADPIQAGTYLTGEVVVENHPLTENLNWQGLLARRSIGMAMRDTDEVLVWIGDEPLIFLRAENGFRQLGFAFDVRKSNATRLPAFIILLQRFLAGIREEKVMETWANVDTRQRIPLAFAMEEGASTLTLRIEGGGATEFSLGDASFIRAPDEPGFFEIWQGDQRLFRGAAQFSDAREANFRDAAAFNGLKGLDFELVESHQESDDLWRLWTLLLAALLLGSWYYSDRKRRPREDIKPAPKPLHS